MPYIERSTAAQSTEPVATSTVNIVHKGQHDLTRKVSRKLFKDAVQHGPNIPVHLFQSIVQYCLQFYTPPCLQKNTIAHTLQFTIVY